MLRLLRACAHQRRTKSFNKLATLVVAQTVRYGFFDGLKVAIAPLLTDAPIIALSVLLVGQLAKFESVLGITEQAYRLAMRLESEGRSRLARVFSLIMLGDFVSVELARLEGKDAMEIKRIDELKRRMAQKRG